MKRTKQIILSIVHFSGRIPKATELKSNLSEILTVNCKFIRCLPQLIRRNSNL